MTTLPRMGYKLEVVNSNHVVVVDVVVVVNIVVNTSMTTVAFHHQNHLMVRIVSCVCSLQASRPGRPREPSLSSF